MPQSRSERAHFGTKNLPESEPVETMKDWQEDRKKRGPIKNEWPLGGLCNKNKTHTKWSVKGTLALTKLWLGSFRSSLNSPNSKQTSHRPLTKYNGYQDTTKYLLFKTHHKIQKFWSIVTASHLIQDEYNSNTVSLEYMCYHVNFDWNIERKRIATHRYTTTYRSTNEKWGLEKPLVHFFWYKKQEKKEVVLLSKKKRERELFPKYTIHSEVNRQTLTNSTMTSSFRTKHFH